MRRCETAACFLKEQQSLWYCLWTALQRRASLAQIHIKVRPAEKEMLRKYILKRSVTSLSRHQGEGKGGEGGGGGALSHKLVLDVWRRPLREISQEALLVTDTRGATPSDSSIRRGRRKQSWPGVACEGRCSKGGEVASGPSAGAGKSLLSLSQRSRASNVG